jgi:hypothetical protein
VRPVGVHAIMILKWVIKTVRDFIFKGDFLIG